LKIGGLYSVVLPIICNLLLNCFNVNNDFTELDTVLKVNYINDNFIIYNNLKNLEKYL